MRNKILFLTSLFVVLISFSCKNKDYTPKKRSYPKIIFPERKGYKTFTSDQCPFSFEVPDYAEVDRDSTFFHQKIENPCWYDIEIKPLSATFHLTYYEITSQKQFDDLVEDMHNLTFRHTVKADFIDDLKIHSSRYVNGLLYEVGGNAASPFQFYLTDSVHNYIRGSVYINTAPNIDSLQPVIDFLKEDMMHLIGTFKWE